MLNYFTFRRIGNDFLIVNLFGQHALVARSELDALVHDTDLLPEKKKDELEAKKFILTENDRDDVAALTGLVRKSKSHLFHSTGLHILVLTNECNYDCIYCQAKGTGYANGRMTAEIARKAIDIALCSPERSLSFEFQGGEPLLCFDVLKDAVEYAESRKSGKELSFSVVSNLSVLTSEMADYISKRHISVSTSLDGPAWLQNSNRVFHGRDSFQAVEQGLALLRSKGITVSAIQTTARNSIEHPIEIVDAYADLGFDQMFIRPLTPLGKASACWNEIGYTAEEYVEFYRKSIDYLIILNRKGIRMKEFFSALLLKRILNMDSGNYMDLRSPCGAGIGQMAYYYNGDVFACDEGRMLYEMGDDSWRLGNVFDSEYDDLVGSTRCRSISASSLTETDPICCDCAYQGLCGICPIINLSDKTNKLRMFRCKIMSGILDLLFEKIYKGTEEDVSVLRSWADEK